MEGIPGYAVIVESVVEFTLYAVNIRDLASIEDLERERHSRCIKTAYAVREVVRCTADLNKPRHRLVGHRSLRCVVGEYATRAAAARQARDFNRRPRR